MENEKYFTVTEAAEVYGFSKDYVRNQIRCGRLTGKKIGSPHGGYWVVAESSLRAFEPGRPGRPRVKVPPVLK
jgi:excisionase family DNA binding protein